MFDEEMRDPSQSIGHEHRSDNEPRPSKHSRHDQKRPTNERSREMKGTGERMPVRQHIKAPELGETVRLLHWGDSSADK